MKNFASYLICLMVPIFSIVMGPAAQTQLQTAQTQLQTAQESALIGTWDCRFTWENSFPLTAVFVFKSDGSLKLSENYPVQQEGKWRDLGDGKVIWLFTVDCTIYSGTLDPGGTRMSGTMTGMTGNQSDPTNKEVTVGNWMCTKRTSKEL